MGHQKQVEKFTFHPVIHFKVEGPIVQMVSEEVSSGSRV